VNLLSRTQIGEHQLSTAFQFGEFAGVGIAFGDKRQFDLGVRYQHVSNADIKSPTTGSPTAASSFNTGSIRADVCANTVRTLRHPRAHLAVIVRRDSPSLSENLTARRIRCIVGRTGLRRPPTECYRWLT
jgi:hypothetical protein